MSTHRQTVVQMAKMLRNLDGWLGKAVAFAEAKSMSPDQFVGFRLAPDMYPFGYQVQSCCHTAVAAGARLTGGAPTPDVPPDPNPRVTMAELRQGIADAIAVLDGYEPQQFEGASEQVFPLSFAPGMGMAGSDYIAELMLPHFYFHVVTAYDLLRLAGVDLHKMEFLGSLSLRPL